MRNTIEAGDYSAIIEGEDTNKVVTELRVRGADGRITTSQAEAAAGNGHLIEDKDDRTMWYPQGEVYYIANTDSSADMDVYVSFDGIYLDSGGLG